MKMLHQSVLIAACVAGLTTMAHAEALFVKSSIARVMATPSFSATKLAELPQGSEVDSLSNRGSWVEIRYDDVTGWVSKFQLNSNAPATSVIDLDEIEVEDSDRPALKLRRRASAYSTAAAARGLAANEQGEEGSTSNYAALEVVELIRLESAEIDAFGATIRP